MAADAGKAQDLYIGTRGGEFVQNALTSGDDVTASIERVQQRGALRNPDCEPLLGLLDHMGQSRADVSTRAAARRATGLRAERSPAQVYHAMLGAALGQLKERIPRLTQSALLKLLEVRTFASTCSEPAAALSAARARLGVLPVHQAGGGARRAARCPGQAQPGAGRVSETGAPAARCAGASPVR
jgi:hypothetical protein